MKLFLLILTILLISANCYSQNNRSKTITRLDSLFRMEAGGTENGKYEFCQVNLKNTSSTKIDSVRFWHINEDSDTSLISFYVLNRQGLRSDDSLKYMIAIEPSTSYPYNIVEVLLNMPFPYSILVELFNSENTSSKACAVTGRFKNRP